MSFFARVSNLWKGFLSLFVEGLENKNPEIVYESAINQRVQQYQKLMKAVSGIVYLRNKLQKELEEKMAKLKEVQQQLPIAVQEGDDEVSLVLIEQKNSLTADIDRIKSELDKVSQQAEDAKTSLITFQGEIEKLKAEKDSMLAKRENAMAQKKIQEQLSNLTVDADVKALNGVRDSIHKLEAEVDIAKEINSGSLDNKLKNIKAKTANATAQNELEEMKKQMNLKQSQSINVEKKL
ncbi:MAG: PspA/IM30 family protein [Candidatus Sericytochromatia bacterium]